MSSASSSGSAPFTSVRLGRSKGRFDAGFRQGRLLAETSSTVAGGRFMPKHVRGGDDVFGRGEVRGDVRGDVRCGSGAATRPSSSTSGSKASTEASGASPGKLSVSSSLYFTRAAS